MDIRDGVNIIALERAGIDMGVDKEAYLASVKEELADEYGDLTADGKPTDLERTALAMYALGLDPRNIDMEDGSHGRPDPVDTGQREDQRRRQ